MGTTHATAAKLKSKDSDGQDFLGSIVVSDVEKKGVDALFKKELIRRSGAEGARTTQVPARGKSTGEGLDQRPEGQ